MSLLMLVYVEFVHLCRVMKGENMKKGQQAFTLTELLVVMVVIVVLSAIVLPKYTKMIEARKATEAATIMTAIRDEQEARCSIGKGYEVLSKVAVVKNQNGKNFTYADIEDSVGVIASAKGKNYSLSIPSYADGRICCTDKSNGAACADLASSYPSCTDLTTRADYVESNKECGAEAVTVACNEGEERTVNCGCETKRTDKCIAGHWENGECEKIENAHTDGQTENRSCEGGGTQVWTWSEAACDWEKGPCKNQDECPTKECPLTEEGREQFIGTDCNCVSCEEKLEMREVRNEEGDLVGCECTLDEAQCREQGLVFWSNAGRQATIGDNLYDSSDYDPLRGYTSGTPACGCEPCLSFANKAGFYITHDEAGNEIKIPWNSSTRSKDGSVNGCTNCLFTEEDCRDGKNGAIPGSVLVVTDKESGACACVSCHEYDSDFDTTAESKTGRAADCQNCTLDDTACEGKFVWLADDGKTEITQIDDIDNTTRCACWTCEEMDQTGTWDSNLQKCVNCTVMPDACSEIFQVGSTSQMGIFWPDTSLSRDARKAYEAGDLDTFWKKVGNNECRCAACEEGKTYNPYLTWCISCTQTPDSCSSTGPYEVGKTVNGHWEASVNWTKLALDAYKKNDLNSFWTQVSLAGGECKCASCQDKAFMTDPNWTWYPEYGKCLLCNLASPSACPEGTRFIIGSRYITEDGWTILETDTNKALQNPGSMMDIVANAYGDRSGCACLTCEEMGKEGSWDEEQQKCIGCTKEYQQKCKEEGKVLVIDASTGACDCKTCEEYYKDTENAEDYIGSTNLQLDGNSWNCTRKECGDEEGGLLAKMQNCAEEGKVLIDMTKSTCHCGWCYDYDTKFDDKAVSSGGDPSTCNNCDWTTTCDFENKGETLQVFDTVGHCKCIGCSEGTTWDKTQKICVACAYETVPDCGEDQFFAFWDPKTPSYIYWNLTSIANDSGPGSEISRYWKQFACGCISCPDGLKWDPVVGRCVNCPTQTVPCDDKSVWSITECSCVECPEGMEKNGNTCSCPETRYAECANQNQIVNPVTCKCEDCPEGFTSVGGTKCECQKDPKKDCADGLGKILNYTTCQCEDCPEGKQSDDGLSCKCLKDAKTACPGENQRLNSVTCQCEECPTGTRPNADKTACESIPCPVTEAHPGMSGYDVCKDETFVVNGATKKGKVFVYNSGYDCACETCQEVLRYAADATTASGRSSDCTACYETKESCHAKGDQYVLVEGSGKTCSCKTCHEVSSEFDQGATSTNGTPGACRNCSMVPGDCTYENGKFVGKVLADSDKSSCRCVTCKSLHQADNTYPDNSTSSNGYDWNCTQECPYTPEDCKAGNYPNGQRGSILMNPGSPSCYCSPCTEEHEPNEEGTACVEKPCQITRQDCASGKYGADKTVLANEDKYSCFCQSCYDAHNHDDAYLNQKSSNGTADGCSVRTCNFTAEFCKAQTRVLVDFKFNNRDYRYDNCRCLSCSEYNSAYNSNFVPNTGRAADGCVCGITAENAKQCAPGIMHTHVTDPYNPYACECRPCDSFTGNENCETISTDGISCTNCKTPLSI